MYSVYYKIDGRWVRLSTLALPKAQAVRAFQNTLLSSAMNGWTVELRKIRPRDLLADLILVPYLGRIYDSEAQVLRDWEADKDFGIRGQSAAVNKRDAIKHRREGNGVIVIYGSKMCWIPFPKS